MHLAGQSAVLLSSYLLDLYIQSFYVYLFIVLLSSYQLDCYIQRFDIYLFTVLLSEY